MSNPTWAATLLSSQPFDAFEEVLNSFGAAVQVFVGVDVDGPIHSFVSWFFVHC